MEARSFITAREMLNDGNWLLTTMNGEPRYEKPPLPSWITALFGGIFGIKNVFALRLPTAIMASLVGIFTYLFSKLFVEKQQSIINGLIVISSFYVIAICNEAPADIYTHAFMLIAIFVLAKSYSGKRIAQNMFFASLFIAFSVLSKGPVSLYALLLPFLLAYALVYGIKNRYVVKTLVPLLVGIALGGIWFLYVRFADSEAFLRIADTETGNWTGYNIRPFYYYWSFFIQSGIWAIPAFISLLYPYLIKRVNNKKAYRLSFFWTIFAVILLSIIPEKKSRYLMPVLIPLAINTGFYIQYLIEHFSKLNRKFETLPVYFFFGVYGILGIAMPVINYFVFQEFLVEFIFLYITSSLLFITIGFCLLYALKKKDIHYTFLFTVAFFALTMSTLTPVYLKTKNKTEYVNSISSLKEEHNKQNLKIYYLDTVSPETLWVYGEKIPHWDIDDNNHSKGPLKFGLLVNNPDSLLSSSIPDNYNYKELAIFDLNTKGSSKKRPRFISHYFELTKK